MVGIVANDHIIGTPRAADLKPDIVSLGRIPKEYIKGNSKKYSFKVTLETVKKLPKHTILMHPLPRIDELATEVDSYPNAIYFQQAKNGLYIREALLALVL